MVFFLIHIFIKNNKIKDIIKLHSKFQEINLYQSKKIKKMSRELSTSSKHTKRSSFRGRSTPSQSTSTKIINLDE